MGLGSEQQTGYLRKWAQEDTDLENMRKATERWQKLFAEG